MGKAMIVIPSLIFVILLGLMWYFKPPFVAAKDSTTGKRSLVWKRALISDIVLTIAAVVVIFMFAPELFTMF